MTSWPQSSQANLLLEENIKLLCKAQNHLQTSYEHVIKIGQKDVYSEAELEVCEALTSRFARLVDMLVKKSYRTLDYYELIEGGTLLDVMNRAEKRGLIASLTQIRTLKDIRNMIAHEYAGEKFMETLELIILHTPELNMLVDKFNDYSKKALTHES